MMTAILSSPTTTVTAASPPPDAKGVFTGCLPTGVGLVACVQGELDGVLAKGGLETAFHVLENVSRLDPRIDAESHNLAHHLGRNAFTYYASSADALRHCPTTMASGCFHGVLERHFNTVGPPKTSADVASLCAEADGQFRFFQCLHGLGHGLDMVAMHDLPKALDWCGLLGEGWQRESCAGGAFMENIVGDTTMEHHHDEADGEGGTDAGAATADHHHHEGMEMPPASTWVRLKLDDLQYPCDVVDESWWHACYWLQSSAMLHQGLNLAEAFHGCDAAPAPYDVVCYESMGRDISGTALRNGALVRQLCDLGNDSLQPYCLKGAVDEMMNNAGSPEPGFDFCLTVSATAKPHCYMGVGTIIAALHPIAADRAAACGRAEPLYVRTCAEAAGA